jgi:hypothetical protein
MIVGDFLFVPHFGIIAAAIVSTVSYAVNLFTHCIFSIKTTTYTLQISFDGRKEDYAWLRLLVKKII